ADVKPAEVDLISAHGTATRVNDVTEARAIRQVFGDHPPRTVSIKSMLGHTLGAASALAAIACALAITHGFIPPTINHVETDPDCELDCVPNKAVPADLRVVQNNGFAFGGNNAVLILGRVRAVTAQTRTSRVARPEAEAAASAPVGAAVRTVISAWSAV